MQTRTVAFTANYSRTNSNFVIQNLPPLSKTLDVRYQSLFAVLKNLLQRGAIAEQTGGQHTGTPTLLSHDLEKEGNIGNLTQREDYKKSLFLISPQAAQWHDTIKGDDANQYYPAREFFDDLPNSLAEYGFVQQLMLPETPLQEIHSQAGKEFVHQQVDFYCPPAKLIIEIDGFHHKGIVKVKDIARDKSFSDNGVLTIRIETKDWSKKTPAFNEAIEQIKNRLIEKEATLRGTKAAYERLCSTGFTTDEIRYKLLPTAVMRFQLLVVELLISGRLSLLDERWHFVVKDADGLRKQSEKYACFASMAVGDLFCWLEPLCKLMGLPFRRPMLEPVVPADEIRYQSGAIAVNFSLLQRYTDEHRQHPETIYVRTDYFQANQELDGKNYFRVSTTTPISYKLENTVKVRETLRFFLQNLFRKDDFREGQLPIILNALNRKDTIGLLPTGGGKSLCYQLPCLLQPAISVVVCPIKSLMYDQKDNLDKAHITRTNYITGELEAHIKEAIQREFSEGHYFFIWISPERFQVKTFRTYLDELNSKRPLAYAVIDEVHCMSEWGHDFRTSYLNLTKTIHTYCPQANLLGLTATASLNVLRNIRIEFARGSKEFDVENLKTKLDFTRPELKFEVVTDGGKKADVLTSMLKGLTFLHTGDATKAGIIFTPHTNGDFGCYDRSNSLNKQFPWEVNWYSGSCPTKTEFIDIPNAVFDGEAGFCETVANKLGKRLDQFAIKRLYWNRRIYIFTGGKVKKEGCKTLIIGKVPVLSEDDFEAHKSKAQKDFKGNKFPLMVATKAFGMGIDKQNIYYTFHYGIPGSTESLYQEAGRAGRWDIRQEAFNKGQQAICRILFSPETLPEDQINKLFAQKTMLPEIKGIIQHPEQGDALRQMFLFQMGLESIEEELDVMQKLFAFILVHSKSPVVNVLWKLPSKDFKEAGEAEDFFKMLETKNEEVNKAIIEKALYRLSILGVVQNWTTDFVCHFSVSFSVLTDAQIKQNLIAHIVKYSTDYAQNTDLLAQQIDQTTGQTPLEKCMRFLLQWSWETISFNRRESLRNIYELCLNYNGDSTSFKRSLENYFRVDELTIIFQYIADHPEQFNQWKQAFLEKGLAYVKNSGGWKARTEALSRFLESNRENLGLDTISGLYRLALNDYDNLAGRSRLENTLARLRTYLKSDDVLPALKTIIHIAKNITLPVEARYELAGSINKYHPEANDWVCDELGILNVPHLTSINNRLTTLNQRLYDNLRQIG